MVRTWRARSGLRGSATGDALLAFLDKQSEPHPFAGPNARTGNCTACALAPDSPVHDKETRK